MKRFASIILTLLAINCFAQKLEIITVGKSKITTTLLDSVSKKKLLKQFNGKQDNSIRKKWTARTFQLSDNKILIEFYDQQAILIESLEDLKALDQVRFVKNVIWNLKKNISYKIELTFEEGKEKIQLEKPKALTQYRSDMPEWYDFEVYELSTGQILFLDKSQNHQSSTIYPDLKTLASENATIEEQVYGFEDEKYLMRLLASGDRLPDYDVEYHLIYPEYLEDIIKSHKLNIIEHKVYVSEFFGNLYKSERGYYILVDEIDQKNGAGDRMQILSLRIYDSIEQLKQEEKRYRKYKNKPFKSEHFYREISDEYEQRFPEYVPQLIDKLPSILNFDKEQLSIDSIGMDLVDEAIKWNGTNYKLFDRWFPSVLAYYGDCYIKEKKDGVWTAIYNSEGKVWIPIVKLKDGSTAWDWIEFYKSLYEGPIPIRWAGDWEGDTKKFLKLHNEEKK